MSYRKLSPHQASQVWIHDTVTTQNTLLFETRELLLEAPNWSPDGTRLILNGNGVLWGLSVENPSLQEIVITGVPPLNNDHVIAPDGETVFLSAYDDWQMYRAPLKGGAAEKVTGKENPEGLMHFLHGVAPDGKRLSFVGIRADRSGGGFKILFSAIFTIGADGRGYRQLTGSDIPVDGPEYSPDGEWIYFNTENFTGHAQIARMRVDGSDQTRLTFSETVDWFPHFSPDGQAIVYLAYPPGTRGHPADHHVSLMLVRQGDWSKPSKVASLFGGQGTINVNSWSPDSKRFAYVAYPINPATN